MAIKLSRREKKDMKAALGELVSELWEAMDSLAPITVEYARSSNAYNDMKRSFENNEDDRSRSRLLAASIDLKTATDSYNRAGAYVKDILARYDDIYTKLLGFVGNGEARRLTSDKERMMREYDQRREDLTDSYTAIIKPEYVDEAEQTPAEQKPDEQTPAEQKPDEQTPAEQKPDQQTPAEQKPDEQTPAEQKPDAQTPAEQKPDAQTPAEQKPDAQTPAEQKPDQQTPAEQKPDQQTPAEQKPDAQTPAEQNNRRFDTESSITRVNVAPVTLDIAPIVERAINATIARLNLGMEKKIDEYVASLSLPASGAALRPAESAPISQSSAALADQLAEEERNIHDRLKELCTSVGQLIDQLTELTTVYYNLSSKQKELADLQRSTNDMQRATLREQQGIQVNQRVIAQDQASLNEQQAIVMDKQKSNIEQQKLILEEQDGITASQKAMADSQTALQEAVKGVAETQRQIQQAQSAIIQASNKSLESNKAIADKQAEVAELQKQSMTRQRQLLKDQKVIRDRLEKKDTDKE